MKKIILFLTILSVIVGLKVNVEALTYSDKFYISDVIDNIYYGKTKNGVTEYRKAKFKRRKSDNQVVYCIEPFVDLNEGATLTGYDYNYEQLLHLSNSDWERISLLAYYGYGYEGHTDNKWYPITQILIWKTIDKNATFFWTDTFQGNKVTKFETEISELENLVSNHKKLPGQANRTYNMSINQSISMYDVNGTIGNYEVSTDQDIDISVNGNIMYITSGNEEKTVTVTLTKKDKKYNTPPIVYVSDSYQNTLVVGSFNDISTTFKINVNSGSIKIKKLDSETGINPQGEASLIGTVYEVFKDNSVVGTITIGDNNEGVLDHLEFGRYIIKEKESGVGYKIDQKEYIADISNTHRDEVFELSDEVIKNKIKITKYYENNKPEKDITFMIYDSKGELYKEVTTDENGVIELELVYGTYTVKQKNTTEGYAKVEDFVIEVKEDSNNVFEYYLNDIKVPDTEENLKTLILNILLLIVGLLLLAISLC